MNYILYEDGSKEQIINYSIIDGNLCGVWAPSGYYTFYEVITRHPESGLCIKLPVFEKRILFEDNLYGKIRTEYIQVNNIKEVVQVIIMKDIFDECQFGELNLNSRIVRTGTWETETEEGGFLSPAIYDKYEKIASSGTGLIISEMFVLDHKDRFAPYCANLNYLGFVKEYKMITDICHNYDVPVLGQLAFFYYDDGDNQKAEPNDLKLEGIRKLQAEVIMAAKKFSFAGFL